VNTSNDPLDAIGDIVLQTFAATEFDKIFSSREPRQGVEDLRRFRDRFRSLNCGERSHLDAAVCPRRFCCSCWCSTNCIYVDDHLPCQETDVLFGRLHVVTESAYYFRHILPSVCKHQRGPHLTNFP
jgi:hypothetical protein